MSATGDATSSAQEAKHKQPEPRRFELVPSTNRSTNTTSATATTPATITTTAAAIAAQELAQDGHEGNENASSGNYAGHDDTGHELVMI